MELWSTAFRYKEGITYETRASSEVSERKINIGMDMLANNHWEDQGLGGETK
jgi:hypothetical protein